MGFFDRLSGVRGAAPGPQSVSDLPIHFAIVDVETTGLDPQVHRVIEIAVVLMDSKGVVIHEWCTLVNPGHRDSGPEHIHGIKGDWLTAAPTFAEIAGDLRDRLVGRVLTAHNSKFDMGFVSAELFRAGAASSDAAVPNFDTMGTAESVGLPRALRNACAQLGIEYQPHDALEDARATARLLARLLPVIDPRTFPPSVVVPAGWISESIPASGLSQRRAEAERLTRPSDFLSDAVTRLPPFDASLGRDSDVFTAYRDMVAAAIADGYVSPAESESLISLAASLSMSPAEARDVHHELFLSLLDAALLDRKISKDERADLERAATWLGVNVADWDGMVKAARTRVKSDQALFKQDMSGKVVAFTGRGVHPNNVREGLCAKLGMEFKSTVTKDTNLLVMGGWDTENANVQRAHDLGIPMMIESLFWQRLGEL